MQPIFFYIAIQNKISTWIQVLQTEAQSGKCYEQLLAPALIGILVKGNQFYRKIVLSILTLVFLSTADAPAELNCSFPQPNTYQYHHIVCYENQATPTNNFCQHRNENQPNINITKTFPLLLISAITMQSFRWQVSPGAGRQDTPCGNICFILKHRIMFQIFLV